MRLYLCPEKAEMSDPKKNGHPPKPRGFNLGRLMITMGALQLLDQQDVLAALRRHASGDWGDVDSEDWAANERALLEDTRLVSVYHSSAGEKFYIITEWDRSLTTILLPSEY
jgi:hypothetical protein